MPLRVHHGKRLFPPFLSSVSVNGSRLTHKLNCNILLLVNNNSNSSCGSLLFPLKIIKSSTFVWISQTQKADLNIPRWKNLILFGFPLKSERFRLDCSPSSHHEPISLVLLRWQFCSETALERHHVRWFQDCFAPAILFSV